MPPKKGDKKPPPVVINGISTQDMTREQLQVFALKLKEELDREREERSHFQHERDKTRTFWEISKKQLEEAKTKIAFYNANMDNEVKINDEQIQHLRQKAKHLTYEHDLDISEVKEELEKKLEIAEEEHNERERQLMHNKLEKKEQLNARQASNLDEITSLKKDHAEILERERLKYEEMTRIMKKKFDDLYDNFKADLRTRLVMTIVEVEERKNMHIQTIVSNHKEKYKTMQNYYNDVTINNLAVVSSMKEQILSQYARFNKLSEKSHALAIENKKLTEPFREAEAEVKELNRQLTNCTKDKMALKNTHIKLSEKEHELEQLKIEYNNLLQKYDVRDRTRERLRNDFITTILAVQEKTELKNAALQRKLTTLNDIFERKDALLTEFVSQNVQEPNILNSKLEELLKMRTAIIRELKEELSRVCKAHHELLLSYEATLEKFGIPEYEVAYNPLRFLPLVRWYIRSVHSE